jgi:hypothetical protein
MLALLLVQIVSFKSFRSDRCWSGSLLVQIAARPPSAEITAPVM